jgi:hypothetical protein
VNHQVTSLRFTYLTKANSPAPRSSGCGALLDGLSSIPGVAGTILFFAAVTRLPALGTTPCPLGTGGTFSGNKAART